MLTGQTYTDTVYGYWARRFHCPQEDFFQPGSRIIEEDDLLDSGKAYLYRFEQMSIIRIDPSIAETIELLDGIYPQPVALTAESLQDMAGGQYHVRVKSTLLDHFLDPGDFKPFSLPAGYNVRRIDPEKENDILLDFYDACTPEDLDEALIYIDEPDPVILGAFSASQMAAYASHRYWEDVLADIGVLVHPDYRRRGLGKAVVSALCQWCFDHNKVPMYRVFADNPNSLRIPHALGFELVVRIETLEINNE